MSSLKLPKLEDPQRYAGLYIFDFGDQVALGYTAAEIAILLDHDKFKGGKVYKIYRAYPDGRLEIKGVAGQKFLQESDMVFWFDTLASAGQAFEQLRQSADQITPPCRSKVQLSTCTGPPLRHCIAVIYPAEFEEEMGRWMLDIDFQAGFAVEAGPSVVSRYYDISQVRDSFQLWGTADQTSRSKQQVLETVHLAVQR